MVWSEAVELLHESDPVYAGFVEWVMSQDMVVVPNKLVIDTFRWANEAAKG